MIHGRGEGDTEGYLNKVPYGFGQVVDATLTWVSKGVGCASVGLILGRCKSLVHEMILYFKSHTHFPSS